METQYTDIPNEVARKDSRHNIGGLRKIFLWGSTASSAFGLFPFFSNFMYELMQPILPDLRQWVDANAYLSFGAQAGFLYISYRFAKLCDFVLFERFGKTAFTEIAAFVIVQSDVIRKRQMENDLAIKEGRVNNAGKPIPNVIYKNGFTATRLTNAAACLLLAASGWVLSYFTSLHGSELAASMLVPQNGQAMVAQVESLNREREKSKNKTIAPFRAALQAIEQQRDAAISAATEQFAKAAKKGSGWALMKKDSIAGAIAKRYEKQEALAAAKLQQAETEWQQSTGQAYERRQSDIRAKDSQVDNMGFMIKTILRYGGIGCVIFALVLLIVESLDAVENQDLTTGKKRKKLSQLGGAVGGNTSSQNGTQSPNL